MSPEPLLSVENLVKRFGGFRALDGVSFHLDAGEVLGLVGPNGSGKTTCINVISGLYAPDGGAVLFDGRSIGGIASHRLARRGINRTFQLPKPFLSLTVRGECRDRRRPTATPARRPTCRRCSHPSASTGFADARRRAS